MSSFKCPNLQQHPTGLSPEGHVVLCLETGRQDHLHCEEVRPKPKMATRVSMETPSSHVVYSYSPGRVTRGRHDVYQQPLTQRLLMLMLMLMLLMLLMLMLLMLLLTPPQVLQIVFVSTPSLIYMGHAMHTVRREEKRRSREEEEDPGGGEKHRRKGDKDRGKEDKPEGQLAGRVRLRGALLQTYVLSILLRSAMEVRDRAGPGPGPMRLDLVLVSRWTWAVSAGHFLKDTATQ